MALAAVLPLKTTGPRDSGNLGHARNLIDTLHAFWRGAAALPFAIYCPADEVETARAELPATPRIAVAVHAEHTLLPGLARFPRIDGWFKQQALKMAFATATPADFYLTFDGDILCCRPFDDTTFITGGLGAMDYDPVALHPGWMRESARLLGISPPLPERVMSVTPHLFHAATMRGLLARLDAAWHNGWLYCLLSHATWSDDQWTEATLYWLHAWSAGTLAAVHQPNSSEIQRFHSQIDIWVAGQHAFETWDPPGYVANGGPGNFIVCQSTAGYTPQTVRTKIATFLKTS